MGARGIADHALRRARARLRALTPGRLAYRAVASLVPPTVLARRGPGSRRRVAFSFDDGPDGMTRQYLDVLEAASARATFFVTGAAAAARPDDVAEMARRGHEVSSHGYSHLRFPDIVGSRLDSELSRTAAALPRAPTPRPLVRPPHGDISIASLLACARRGYVTVMWSVDGMDYRGDGADAIASRCDPARITSGDIVLLHEGEPDTLAALPGILAALRRDGYDLVTVGELLGLACSTASYRDA